MVLNKTDYQIGLKFEINNSFKCIYNIIVCQNITTRNLNNKSKSNFKKVQHKLKDKYLCIKCVDDVQRFTLLKGRYMHNISRILGYDVCTSNYYGNNFLIYCLI